MAKSLKKALFLETPKEIAAIALIYKGIEIIESGDYMLGPAMVVVGGVLILIDQLI
uniref:Uncharacterized protein n=1 Tax=viral metagenome TaxID=1070528 RepID=A0A6M3LLZ5_9ZZZZ